MPNPNFTLQIDSSQPKQIIQFNTTLHNRCILSCKTGIERKFLKSVLIKQTHPTQSAPTEENGREPLAGLLMYLPVQKLIKPVDFKL